MGLFGLIGYPLAHSFSKKYFTDKFNREELIGCAYENFEIATIDTLRDVIIANPNLEGLNVTIPYKTTIIPFLNSITDDAQKIGAVNTIKIETINGKKRLKGFNTDVYGFEQSLLPLLKPYHTKAIIIGSGGAARAVAFVLTKLKMDYLLVSRNIKKVNATFNPTIIDANELNEDQIHQHPLIINTTPLGTFPAIETFPPLPYQAITPKHLIYDLVYNPEETVFLAKAKQQGAQIKNGLEMLQLQADKAWEVWNLE